MSDESSGATAPVSDALVIFGITGDLAKVMTYHSLYRLERRGLLDCPIIGVAIDDYTVDQLAARARESITELEGGMLDEGVFARLVARLSGEVPQRSATPLDRCTTWRFRHFSLPVSSVASVRLVSPPMRA